MLHVPHPLIVAAGLCLVGQAYWPGDWLVRFAPYFVVGALLHEYAVLRRWSWVVAGLGVAVLPYRPFLALALIVAPLAIAIGTRSWPGLRDAGRFGDLSYGIYVYAWPVQQIIVAYAGPSDYFALLAATLAVLIPLAWLSWRCVEAPALGRKPLREPGRLRVGEDGGVG